jgi:hypothetical protein
LALLLHHADADCEYAYGSDSTFGRLGKAFDEAKQKDWTVVDMKNDCKRVFPFEKP